LTSSPPAPSLCTRVCLSPPLRSGATHSTTEKKRKISQRKVSEEAVWKSFLQDWKSFCETQVALSEAVEVATGQEALPVPLSFHTLADSNLRKEETKPYC